MLVVGGGTPEKDRVDEKHRRAPPAFCRGVCLVGVGKRIVVFAVDAGDMIEAVILRDGGAKESLVENVRPAERFAVGAQRRVGLPAAERPPGIEQVRIAWNAIVVGSSAERIRMDRE